MCSFVTDLKVDEGWRLPLLGSASFPLTWGDALTSLCDCKEQNKTRVIPQRRASVQSGACFEWITPTLSPASLFRVLFMISSRRCADQTERDQCSCFSARLWTVCDFLNSLQMIFFSLWPHLLPLQALLLFFLEVLLPLYALTLGLLAGFCFSFLPLK